MIKSKRITAFLLAVVMFVSMAVSAYGYIDNFPNTHRNTGQNIADLIAVARTQLGYAELDPSTGYPIAHNGKAGYTKYGESFGAPTGEWCAYFVSWCARQAGISTSVLPRLGNCAASVKWYKSHSEFRTPSSGYVPKAGDIVFYNWSGGETAKHVGIVTGVSGRKLYTIEGNTGDGRGYDCLAKTRDLTANYIVGYGVPAYNDAQTYVGNHSFAGVGGSNSYSEAVKYTTSKLSVVTTSATEITPTNATLNGSVSNGGRLFVSTAGFFFGTDKLQLSKYPVVTATTKSEIELSMNVGLKVGELTPNTTYYYQTYACIDGRDYLGPMYAVVTVNDIPQKLVLSANSVHVGVGQTVELMWAQLPMGTTDKGVTWTSSDEKVATINNGIIKGVGYGKVTLSAKTNYGNADASCTATVLIPAPDNVQLINENKKSITVRWDAVDGATGYILYRSEYADSEPVEYAHISADEAEFVDKNVVPGERYYYRLMTLAEVVDYNSDLTPVIYTTAKISSPDEVTASNFGALIRVSWSAVDEAKTYTVYRSSDEHGLYTIVGTTTNTVFVDHNVLAGNTYYYKIVASDGNEKTMSDYSATASVVARLNDEVSLADTTLLPDQAPVPKKSNDAEISRTQFGTNNFMF